MQLDIEKVLFKYHFNAVDGFLKSPSQFAYYTNMGTLHSLLDKKQFWLRNVASMNDIREVNNGLDLFYKALTSDNGKIKKRLEMLLRVLHPSKPVNINQLFTNLSSTLRYRSYIMCLTAHNRREFGYGRLSMWRAYSPDNGVAVIFDKNEMLNRFQGDVALSKVVYWNEKHFAEKLSEVIEYWIANIEILQSEKSEYVEGRIIDSFVYAILSMKHPSFREEREWRLIFIESPGYDCSSVKLEHEIVRGGLEKVYKVDVSDYLPQITKSVLISPTAFSTTAIQGIASELETALKWKDAFKKVDCAYIPLRK